MMTKDPHAQQDGSPDLRTLCDALEQSPTAVLISDRGERIVYANAAACKLYDKERAELLGASARLFHQGEASGGASDDVWSGLLAGRSWTGKIRKRRRDGRILPIAVSIAPLYDRLGRTSHFLATHVDLSVRASAGAMADADRDAVEAAALLRALAAEIVHDFHNVLVPLTGFAGLSRNLLSGMAGCGRVLGYLGEIEAAGERVRLLVQQLSALSGKVPSEQLATPVAEVVAEVIALLAPSFAGSLCLLPRLESPLPPAAIERSHLHRVVNDLCRYASAEIGDHGVVVVSAELARCPWPTRCTACGEDHSGSYLRLAVSARGDESGAKHAGDSPIPAPTGQGGQRRLSVISGLAHLHHGHLENPAAGADGCVIAVLLPAVDPDHDPERSRQR